MILFVCFVCLLLWDLYSRTPCLSLAFLIPSQKTLYKKWWEGFVSWHLNLWCERFRILEIFWIKKISKLFLLYFFIIPWHTAVVWMEFAITGCVTREVDPLYPGVHCRTWGSPLTGYRQGVGRASPGVSRTVRTKP